MSKTNEELIREFLERGGKIEVLPPTDNGPSSTMSSVVNQPVKLLSLEEAELLYGEKSERKGKVKKPDFTNINMDVIPDNLKKYLLSKFDNDITKENE